MTSLASRSSSFAGLAKRMGLVLLVSCIGGLIVQTPALAAEHSIGLGAHFFKTVDDLVDDGFDDIEEDGFAYHVSWKIEPEGIFFFEIDAEYYPDGFAGATDGTLVPSAFVGVGHGLYAAVGVGVAYSDDLSDDVSDPIWTGRIGFDWSLLPGLSLDLNANYRTDAFDELEGASSDAVTIGAVIRISF
ncbi:MAG: hypothetical protein MPN21_11120 [Thermoanaerobaculia bacterium]|nr:hypothetical protein [Thermoanaerobaculia bacterium]